MRNLVLVVKWSKNLLLGDPNTGDPSNKIREGLYSTVFVHFTVSTVVWQYYPVMDLCVFERRETRTSATQQHYFKKVIKNPPRPRKHFLKCLAERWLDAIARIHV